MRTYPIVFTKKTLLNPIILTIFKLFFLPNSFTFLIIRKSKALIFEMEEKNSNDMEESPINQLALNPMIFHQRFSHISKQIFEKLDEKNLKICREIAKPWQDCIDNQNILWNKIAKKNGGAQSLQLA